MGAVIQRKLQVWLFLFFLGEGFKSKMSASMGLDFFPL